MDAPAEPERPPAVDGDSESSDGEQPANVASTSNDADQGREKLTGLVNSSNIAQLYEGGHAARDVSAPVSKFLLLPGSSKLFAWEMVSYTLLMYTTIVVPFRLAFDSTPRWEPTNAFTYVDTCVDAFFLLDIARNFRTGYFDYFGDLISDPHKIAKGYASSWLALDIVASFPIDWIIRPEDGGDETQNDWSLLLMLRLCKLWKLLRLVRLFRISLGASVADLTAGGRLKEHFQAYILSLTSSDLAWYAGWALTLLVVAHIDGCLQYSLATLPDADGQIPENSWVARAGLLEQPTVTRYLSTLTHAMLQLLLVSDGVAAPLQPVEHLFFLLSCVGGGLLLVSIIAHLCSRVISKQMNGSTSEYKAKKDKLKQWMVFNRLSPELRRRLRIYYEYAYPGGRFFDESAILNELSLPLQHEVSIFKMRAHLRELQISESDALAPQLALKLKRQVFLDRDILIRAKQPTVGMYFISVGNVEIVMGEKAIAFVGSRLIGEGALLQQSGRAAATVRAIGFCETQLLEKGAFNDLVDHHPMLLNMVKALAEKRGLNKQGGGANKFAAFLSHDWGTDSHGRDNHARVKRVFEALRKRGVDCWFDEREMKGDINEKMAQGIDACASVLIFVTANYQKKAIGMGPRGANDNCVLAPVPPTAHRHTPQASCTVVPLKPAALWCL